MLRTVTAGSKHANENTLNCFYERLIGISQHVDFLTFSLVPYRNEVKLLSDIHSHPANDYVCCGNIRIP